MKADKHVLWVEKYRPTSLDEYIFQDKSHKKAFEQMVTNNTIPHLLLSGVQGSGKACRGEECKRTTCACWDDVH